MIKNCRQCTQQFEIGTEDLKFYDKISPVFTGKKYLIPSPALCPNCRQQRRLVWRNERKLYHRKCDKTGKEIIASYSPSKLYKIYEHKEWWSDTWDARDYGKPYNFNRSFFEQFRELLHEVPRLNLCNSNNENCDYVNYTNYSKDCYLIFGNHHSEKCAYCWRVHDCLNCFDCTQMNDCQYCYECVDCDNCYELTYSQNCQNCSNSSCLFNCRGVQNSFLCAHLVNKNYCILNEQYTPEEYEKKKNKLLEDKEKLFELFQDFILKFPHKALHITGSENCSGDYLSNCKNCRDVFSAKECQDCSRVYLAEKATDCSDCDIVGWPAELCYEGISTCVNANKNLFSSLCWSCSEIMYCDSCFYSKNLFGCIGIRNKEYCILNKQYSKEEYEKLLPQIIEHMRKANEWGEFFPISLSPFSYNETLAYELFPLNQNDANKLNVGWMEEKPDTRYMGKKFDIPKKIEEVSDEIIKEILFCKNCGKNYRIIAQELAFHRKFNLSLPLNCPDCRHKRRMNVRNSRKLYKRTCAKCNKGIETTYTPERSEIIYCEQCYLKKIY